MSSSGRIEEGELIRRASPCAHHHHRQRRTRTSYRATSSYPGDGRPAERAPAQAMASSSAAAAAATAAAGFALRDHSDRRPRRLGRGNRARLHARERHESPPPTADTATSLTTAIASEVTKPTALRSAPSASAGTNQLEQARCEARAAAAARNGGPRRLCRGRRDLCRREAVPLSERPRVRRQRGGMRRQRCRRAVRAPLRGG
jgi:hypothetical protein